MDWRRRQLKPKIHNRTHQSPSQVCSGLLLQITSHHSYLWTLPSNHSGRQIVACGPSRFFLSFMWFATLTVSSAQNALLVSRVLAVLLLLSHRLPRLQGTLRFTSLSDSYFTLRFSSEGPSHWYLTCLILALPNLFSALPQLGLACS